jgi:alkylation response protein AidB-like acyl-CoA dehydrogenase
MAPQKLGRERQGNVMYSLQLSAEQLEIRDTVRDFVTREIKPAALKAERLDVADRSLLTAQIDAASRMGLRTLALSEDLGGAGADGLTRCIVTEELAAGDADIAAILSETSRLGHLLFGRAMSGAQRDVFLPKFLNEDRFHLAMAHREVSTDTKLGVNYHRPVANDETIKTAAAKASGGEWIVNGVKSCIANVPVAALFAVAASIPGQDKPGVLLVPADTPGVTVSAHKSPWQHGCVGDVTFTECRVSAGNLLGGEAFDLLTGVESAQSQLQSIALGVGRAAYEAALDYAQLRVQGGRPLVQHQAIATKLADIAIRLEVARGAVWRAAWAADHPEAFADRSLTDLPLHAIGQVYASEAVVEAAKMSAEIFGAMGVMRDMPLQKYIHDARVCVHSGDGNNDLRLRIAEAITGYRRPANAAMALAGE